MESISELVRRLRTLGRSTDMERRMGDEVRFHLEQQTEKNIRAGMAPDEARRAALLRFGGVESVKESVRDEYRHALVEDFWRDLRYGTRVLTRAPGFALVSILTLAMGIGAATAVFSLVEGVLLRPLPFPEPDRIVRLFQLDATGRRMNVSEPNFDDWKARTHGFVSMAETALSASVPVSGGREPIVTSGAAVSREFFDVMGVTPAVGRGFLPEEQRVGAAPVAIISHRFWTARLGGAPLEGQPLRINDELHQVVGVMPEGFAYPTGADFWTPREVAPPQRSRTAHNFQVVARLADDVPLATANGELSAVSRAMKGEHGDATWMADAAAVPLQEQLTANARPTLVALFGAAVLLLVIACLNVSNLQLARIATRRRELALRMAIGAGRGRILRQMLAEAALLSAAATVVGAGLAAAGVRAIVAAQPGSVPRLDSVGVNGTVLAFACGVAALTALALGLATVLRTSQHELRASLAGGPRTMTGDRGRERVRQGLVVAQVAITIVLLTGASLLARSFVRLLEVDPGYRTSDAVVLDLVSPFSRDAAARSRVASFQQELLARLAVLPGVESVGLVNDFPLGGGRYTNGQFLEMTRVDEFKSYEDVGRIGDQAKARAGQAGYRVASAGYFAAMGIPLLRGRLFDDGDGPDAPHVAVISESLAKAKWPDQDPLGRFVQFGNMDGDARGIRIVGVVADVRELTPEAVPGPLLYLDYRQRPSTQVSVVLASSTPGAVAQAARQAVQQLDPNMPIRIRSMDDALELTLSGRRFSLLLVALFGAAALTLASLGIYGLVSYLVTERTREIGVRMALGAERGDIIRLVAGQGVVLAAAGVVAGLGASLGLTRLVQGLLFGVTATDPVAFAGVAIVTLVVVLAACCGPALRAVRVSPVRALVSE